jgi:gamma-glutamylcyclotransferase (GGCT)/AIG2-like uncharacterized protein YtfP
MPDSPKFIFTYGTLMSTVDTELGRIERRMMQARARLVGRGRVRGRLYDAGACPAAVLVSECRGFVHGEVWMLPQRTERIIRVLDRYEGCDAASRPPHPYRRTIVRVTHELGWELVAWMYEWNRDTRRLKPIRSGIWRPPENVVLEVLRGPLTAARIYADKAA